MNENKQNSLAAIISSILYVVDYPIFVTDLEGHILFKNDSTSKLLQVDPSLSKKITTYCSQIDDSVTESIYEHKGIENQINCFRLSKIPNSKYIIWSVQASHSKSGEPSDHIKKLATIGEMAVAIVHEIRNPLTIINGQASLAEEKLKKGPLSSEFSEKMLKQIISSCERTNHIIKSLLGLARDGETTQTIPYSINEALREVELFSNLRTQSKATVQILKLENDLILQGHPSNFIQVIVNLVKNAKEEHGRERGAWVRVEPRLQGSALEIRVIDSGKGIPKEIEEKIFSPYFTTKPIGQGTGLGLSLCKKIVEDKLSGSIEIDQEHENTCFLVTIPTASEKKSA